MITNIIKLIMKKVIFLFCLILLMFFSLAFKSSTINTFPLFGKMIILDIGHGGEDPGSVYKDEFEKDYNLTFGKSLKKELESLGATVIMTREGDYDLSSPNAQKRKRSDFNNRIKLIDKNSPDIYLSLHMNYLNDSKYYGTQVFYSEVNNQNKSIAESIQNEVNRYFNYDKSTKEIGNDKYMYKNINASGVLIEYGFISNSRDRNNLKSEDYRSGLSKVIAKGIINYFT